MISRLAFFVAALVASGAVHSQSEGQQGLETNLSNIIYCKDYVLTDEAIKPALSDTDVQLCEDAYENFTRTVGEKISDRVLAETEYNANILVSASYMKIGDTKLYKKDFADFPLELKARELPRCRRICNHFATLQP